MSEFLIIQNLCPGLKWWDYYTGILPILANMMKEEDLYIRQQLALCFKYCSGTTLSLSTRNRRP